MAVKLCGQCSEPLGEEWYPCPIDRCGRVLCPACSNPEIHFQSDGSCPEWWGKTEGGTMSGKLDCPENPAHEVILVEYAWNEPDYYDGVSEIQCQVSNKRFGRWTKKELGRGESEPPYGIPKSKK